MKKLIWMLILILMLMITSVSTAYAWPTPIPMIPSFLQVVDIPDAALNRLLHIAADVPQSEPLTRSDLSALNGTLQLDGCNIADAKGIQYCENVSTIYLNENQLSTMPDMSGMAALTRLDLGGNSFASIPAGVVAIPNLRVLQLYDNPLTSLGSVISMTSLETLDLNHCGLTAFPEELFETTIVTLILDGTDIGEIPRQISSMTWLGCLSVNETGISALPDSIGVMDWLETIYASNNDIKALPEDLHTMMGLRELYLSGNKLESLPESLCTLEDLEYLDVSYNGLYSLPEGICTHVQTLLAQGNRISKLPNSLFTSDATVQLNVLLNRLTELPEELADRTFSGLNVEFNFLDMNAGSAARAVTEANESAYKFYERQLMLPVLNAQAVSDSVTLSWPSCPDGAKDGAEWEVMGYVVYQYANGELVKLADLTSRATSYTHSGLSPETACSYRVGVDYHVVDPAYEVDWTTRGYTSVNAETTAAGAAVTTTTGSPEDSTMAESPANASVQAAVSEQATEVSASPGGLTTGAVIVICAGGVLLLGGGAALTVIKLKRRKP